VFHKSLANVEVLIAINNQQNEKKKWQFSLSNGDASVNVHRSILQVIYDNVYLVNEAREQMRRTDRTEGNDLPSVSR
jgi:hypothetical protein